MGSSLESCFKLEEGDCSFQERESLRSMGICSCFRCTVSQGIIPFSETSHHDVSPGFRMCRQLVSLGDNSDSGKHPVSTSSGAKFQTPHVTDRSPQFWKRFTPNHPTGRLLAWRWLLLDMRYILYSNSFSHIKGQKTKQGNWCVYVHAHTYNFFSEENGDCVSLMDWTSIVCGKKNGKTCRMSKIGQK